jgi:tRNA-splicing ligase RtcB
VIRKGAIRARRNDRGVIPGSMGTSSYIVTGLGNPTSFDSCSHGAGRRLSRTAARRELTAESLEAAMSGKTWQSDEAEALVDEHPLAYKDVEEVMAAQRDLVRIDHRLRQVLNYKGAR